MRYIIQTENKELIQGLVDGEQVELIDGYEPLERLTGRMEKLRIALEEFKASRGSWKILNYYLRGRGIAQGEIDTVLAGVEEFMKNVS